MSTEAQEVPERWQIVEFHYSAETLHAMARARADEDGCSLCGGPCGFMSLVVVSTFGGRPTLARCYCAWCRQNDERVPPEARDASPFRATREDGWTAPVAQRPNVLAAAFDVMDGRTAAEACACTKCGGPIAPGDPVVTVLHGTGSNHRSCHFATPEQIERFRRDKRHERKVLPVPADPRQASLFAEGVASELGGRGPPRARRRAPVAVGRGVFPR